MEKFGSGMGKIRIPDRSIEVKGRSGSGSPAEISSIVKFLPFFLFYGINFWPHDPNFYKDTATCYFLPVSRVSLLPLDQTANQGFGSALI
jgi:hypothetical protein